jgi:hypothetical protein
LHSIHAAGKGLFLLLAAQPNLIEEDIHAMLAEGSESGVIEKHEHAMVRNVFRLDERQIASPDGWKTRGEVHDSIGEKLT